MGNINARSRHISHLRKLPLILFSKKNSCEEHEYLFGQCRHVLALASCPSHKRGTYALRHNLRSFLILEGFKDKDKINLHNYNSRLFLTCLLEEGHVFPLFSIDN